MNKSRNLVFGLVAGVFIVFIGIIFSISQKSNSSGTTSAFGPQTFYNQSCIGCHGDQYQGTVGPSLKNLNKEFTESEVENIFEKRKRRNACWSCSGKRYTGNGKMGLKTKIKRRGCAFLF